MVNERVGIGLASLKIPWRGLHERRNSQPTLSSLSMHGKAQCSVDPCIDTQ